MGTQRLDSAYFVAENAGRKCLVSAGYCVGTEISAK